MAARRFRLAASRFTFGNHPIDLSERAADAVVTEDRRIKRLHPDTIECFEGAVLVTTEDFPDSRRAVESGGRDVLVTLKGWTLVARR